MRDINYKKAIPYLCETLSDTDELVRGYAAETLGEIGDESLIPILEAKLEDEKRNSARLRMYIGLYRLGKKHYFLQILNMLKSKSYRVRCAAANSLVTLADRENISEVIKSLQRALSKEKTIAARSSIECALEELLRVDFVKR